MAKRWSKAEIKLLREEYSDTSKEELLAMLPRWTWKSIKKKASKIGIQKWKSVPWADEEVELLQNIYSIASKQKLLKLFPGRTMRAIVSKARKVEAGDRSLFKEFWTGKEIVLLCNEYPAASRELLLVLFPTRSLCAIEGKARKVGVKRFLENKLWTESEIELLRKHYSTASKDKLLALFPERTFVAIKVKAIKLKAGDRRGLLSRKGIPLSVAHKRSISDSHKKIDHPWLRGPRKSRISKECPHCGKLNEYLPWEAKQSRGFCSTDHWYTFIKENPSLSPNWHRGISSLPYSNEFNVALKLHIRQRDDFQCQLCGIPELEGSKDRRALSIHHIDYDKYNSSEDNLIALCVRCHSTANGCREYFTQFFQNRVMRRKYPLY